jgi:DNA-binding FrmR family transcriptional regulator
MKPTNKMLPNDLTKDILDRLSSIHGQIDGVRRMLMNDQNPSQILNQFKSVQKGLDKAHYLLLDEVYRKALALKIVNAVEACPGNCGNEEKIEYLRKEFPSFQLDDLTSKLKEISEIEKRLEHYKSENNQ